jgi:hypothetical protein
MGLLRREVIAIAIRVRFRVKVCISFWRIFKSMDNDFLLAVNSG